MTMGSQGRLLFPAIGAISILAAVGLVGWAGTRLGRVVATACIAFLLLMTVACPPAIRAAYAPAPLLAESDLPSDMVPLHVRFEGKMELVGYRIQPSVVRTGDRMWVTVWWKALAPMSVDYSVFVQAYCGDDDRLGQMDSYPGLGTRPTSTLRAGDMVADRYAIDIGNVGGAPCAVRVLAGLYDLTTMQRLQVDGAASGTDRVELLGAKAVPGEWATLSLQEPERYDFDGKIQLTGVSVDPAEVHPGEAVTVTLQWQVQQGLGGDYIVFVHALRQDGSILAQG